MTRTATNRVKNWNGTVHYSDDGARPACGAIATHRAWLAPTVATVTCARCIAKYGQDELGHADPVVPTDPLVARRVAERAARQAAREAAANV